MPRIHKEPKATRIARKIGMPESQVGRQDYVLHDVANHSDSDQRHMVRSGDKKTVRRTTKIDQLKKRGIINDREAKACEWYHGAHEQQYAVRLKIAQWDAGSASSDKAFGHWPAKATLGPGETPYEWARSGIHPFIRPLFERVVLAGEPLGKSSLLFRTCVIQLVEHIEGKVAL